MPDLPSDEEFSNLFAQLPDPRTRSSARDAAAESAPPDADPHAGATGTSSPPGSRRAARAATGQASADEARTADRVPADSDDADLLVGASTARAGSRRPAASARPASSRPEIGELDDLFNGRATTDRIGKTPKVDRRKRRLGGFVVLGLLLVLLGGIAAGGLWVWTTYESQIRDVMGWNPPADYSAGEATGEAYVTIVSGDTGSVISQSLYDAGVTRTSTAFYDMLVDTDQDPTFYPGSYQLQQHMTSAAALEALLDPANRRENTATIPEGLSYTAALQRVADATGIADDELLAEAANYTQFGVPAEAPSIEGFLFPATYTFDPGVTAHDAIQRMVDEMFSRLDAAGVAPEDRLRVLSLAALIQREAGPDPADMPKISRVFLNRIDQGMLLQSDATVAYGSGAEASYFTTPEQRADEANIYNTYVHPGLPAGPIGLPGETAIDAAVHPADGSWLYFTVVDFTTGETAFADTLEEHEANVVRMQENCAANADVCQ